MNYDFSYQDHLEEDEEEVVDAEDTDLPEEVVSKAFEVEHQQWVIDLTKFNEQRKAAFDE